MSWKSFFTIEYVLEPMEIWPTGHKTQILLHECLCMSHFINFEGLYMDPIEDRVHDETNQQTQGNLVGMS
jgi:hypothetical protein